MKIYVGAGECEMPMEIESTIHLLTRTLAGHGAMLRTSVKNGTEEAFLKGLALYCSEANIAIVKKRALFLPWDGYKQYKVDQTVNQLSGSNKKCRALVSRYYKPFKHANHHVKHIISCYGAMVLGCELSAHADFVIAYTKSGDTTGKTDTTHLVMKIARAYNIPVYNLGKSEHFDFINSYIERHQKENYTV